MKQKHNGMYGLLAVIALMLAVTIYASCSSDDDAWDSSSLGELGTMADGTLDRSGEGGGTAIYVGIYVQRNLATYNNLSFNDKIEGADTPQCQGNFRIEWTKGYTGNLYQPRSAVYISPNICPNTITFTKQGHLARYDTVCTYIYRTSYGLWNINEEIEMHSIFDYQKVFRENNHPKNTYYGIVELIHKFDYSDLLEHCQTDTTSI